MASHQTNGRATHLAGRRPIEREIDVREDEFGTLIQAYLREKRRPQVADEERLRRIAAQLDVKLKERIDALGLDGERLLLVQPSEVMRQIQAMEREASLEDARAAAAAARMSSTARAAAGARSGQRRTRPSVHGRPRWKRAK
jgi:hypothetical protein